MSCPAGNECPVCNRHVFVTGITGSFGRAFTHRLLTAHTPARLTGFSRDEHKQADLSRDYGDYPGFRLRLGDIRDRDRLEETMEGTDVVVHAAALKIIREGVNNPDQMVLTNILGTMNVLRAAVHQQVKQVLLLSSDKAAEPSTLYGGTKMAAELLTIQWNTYGFPRGCRLSCVRYGNVLGSRGSVVHVFRAQHAAGIPLSVTDPAMTRFWMTLSEAVDFVLGALRDMRGGETMIPKLPSMRVADLAEAIAPKVAWREYERVSGEKTHEVLVTADEATRSVDEGRRIIIEPARLDWPREPWFGWPYPEAYTSNGNTEWLSIEAMRSLLADV